MGGSKASSEPVVIELTEEDKILQALAVDAARLQNAAFGSATGFANFLQQSAQEFDFAGAQGRLDATLAGGPTSEERRLIDQQTESALSLLGADINEFTQEGLDNLRTSLAANLGLRSTDSTILQRGSDIVSEGVDQFGRGATAIRGGAAQQALQLPFQRAALQQDLFNSQLGLAGTGAELGLGLSAPSPIAASVETVKAVKTPGQAETRAAGGLLTSG